MAGRLLGSLRERLRRLDDRAREGRALEAGQRDEASAERAGPRVELRTDVELFLVGLPGWLRRPERWAAPSAVALEIGFPAAPALDEDAAGAAWVVAVDVALGRLPTRAVDVEAAVGSDTQTAGSAAWLARRLTRRHDRHVLAAGTHLRLLGRAAASWPSEDPWADSLTSDLLRGEERGLVFEVEAGPRAGARVRLAALGAAPSGAALVAASMVAPIGHRVADWPSAAADVLGQQQARLAAAERAARMMAYEEGWGWRHVLGDGQGAPGGPGSMGRGTAGRVEREPVVVERDDER
ncbi:MAG TPA: hypothetical protein VF763_08995 [Candidatus Limnocylindrales bacterium]